MLVKNMVLNEVPNSNDAMCIVNNMHSATMGNSHLRLYSQHHAEKLTYQRREAMMREQLRFVRTEISFALGKNGGYMPSSLGSRLISTGRQ